MLHEKIKGLGALEQEPRPFAGTERLEPATSCVTGRRSNRLEFGPSLHSLIVSRDFLSIRMVAGCREINEGEWIGLRKAMPARTRLENFYKKNSIDFGRFPPAWMMKVDSSATLR